MFAAESTHGGVVERIISFGLVNIPVELHGAVTDNARTSGCCTRRTSRRSATSASVSARESRSTGKDIVKGYEYSKGKFVVLTKDDFKAAALEQTKTVEILDFVEAEEIDDRFFDTSYYAVPGKGGERGYAVLREAIRESGASGSARSCCARRSTWPRSASSTTRWC